MQLHLKQTSTQVVPVNIMKFLRTAFFTKHLRWLLLEREALMVSVIVNEKTVKKFLFMLI